MDSKHKFSEGSLYYHEKHFMESFLWIIPSTDCSVYWNLYEYLGPQIEEYSRRTLPHSEDGLKAFLGILKYDELNVGDENGSLSHRWPWGIPLKMLKILKCTLTCDVSTGLLTIEGIVCLAGLVQVGVAQSSFSKWALINCIFGLPNQATISRTERRVSEIEESSVFLRSSFRLETGLLVYIASPGNVSRTYIMKRVRKSSGSPRSLSRFDMLKSIHTRQLGAFNGRIHRFGSHSRPGFPDIRCGAGCFSLQYGAFRQRLQFQISQMGPGLTKQWQVL